MQKANDIATLRVALLKSAYFKRMNECDLTARNLKQPVHVDEVLQNIRMPNQAEKNILEQAIKSVDDITANFKRFSSIKWRILISNDNIETGFPHTHGNIIILPSLMLVNINRVKFANIIDTLIHEKIHVYQRLYPCESNILYLKYWNFTVASCLSQTPDGHRTNPDTNLLLYKDQNDDIIYLNKYNKCALDSVIGDTRDHPHEIMAYLITNILTSISYVNDKNKMYEASTKEWMAKYF